VSTIFGMHVDPTLPVGKVLSRPGPFLAAAAIFLATVTGKGGHAASPHHAIDPIIAASSAVISLQQLVSREIDPVQAAVCYQLSIGYCYGYCSNHYSLCRDYTVHRIQYQSIWVIYFLIKRLREGRKTEVLFPLLSSER
jgi:hypothetical protein